MRQNAQKVTRVFAQLLARRDLAQSARPEWTDAHTRELDEHVFPRIDGERERETPRISEDLIHQARDVYAVTVSRVEPPPNAMVEARAIGKELAKKSDAWTTDHTNLVAAKLRTFGFQLREELLLEAQSAFASVKK